MRLTLRTLLAYLDDMLDPVQTKEIGEKVAESESAQELIARIKKVTRRRQLTTPDEAEADARGFDPNTVAEYLDNMLPGNELTEVERVCLESDVQLAEVAACHQVLTLIQGEPAEVAAPARQRMYGLVHGPEAIPSRRARAMSPEGRIGKEPRGSGDEAAVFGLPFIRHKNVWVRRLMPAAVLLVLAAGLVIVLFQAMGRGEKRLLIAEVSAPPPSDLAKRLPEPVQPGLPAGLVPRTGASQNVSTWTERVGDLSSWVAVRPNIPPNLFLIFGHEDSLLATDVTPPRRVLPGVRPPGWRQTALGLHTTPVAQESLLLRNVGEDQESKTGKDWRFVKTQARVQSGEMLATLPGYRSQLTLDKQTQLELVGHLVEEAASKYVLESGLILHDNAEFDLDFTLDRGRVVVTNLKPAGEALIRVRFHGEVWDLELLEPKSKVGLELTGRLERGGPGAAGPHAQLSLITVGGPVHLTRGFVNERIPPGRLLIWDATIEPEFIQSPFPLGLIPEWLIKQEAASDEVRAALASLHRRIVQMLKDARPDEESKFIHLALDEALEGNRSLEQRLALFSHGAADQLLPVLNALEDSNRFGVREAALATLWHWMGRRPDRDGELRSFLQQARYSGEETDLMLRLLHGLDPAGPKTYEFLIDQLGHERLAIRHLAYADLRELAPTIRFDPAGPADQREKAIATIKTQLLPKAK